MGKKIGFKPLNKLLGVSRSPLGQIQKQAKRNARANKLFLGCLPVPLNQHVEVIWAGDREWRVYADSSAWANKLRYCLPQLKRQLGNILETEAPELSVQIAPPQTVYPQQSMAHREPMDAETAEYILSVARSLNDPHISPALERLSKRGLKR